MASLRRSRSAPDKNYAQVPNEWARHKTMGLEARAVLVWLISHEDGWEMSRGSLVAQNEWLTDFKARKALEELEGLKILWREQENRSGRFGKSLWLLVYPGDIYPAVGWSPTDGIPTNGSPTDGPPTSGLPTVGSQPVKKTKEEHQQEEPPNPPPATPSNVIELHGDAGKVAMFEAIEAAFDRCWAAWPKDRRVDKPTSRKRFAAAAKKIGVQRLEQAMLAHAAAYDPWPPEDRQFIRTFPVWLSPGKDSWENPIPAARITPTKETGADRTKAAAKRLYERNSDGTHRDGPAPVRSIEDGRQNLR